jgi:hypothetical protein
MGGDGLLRPALRMQLVGLFSPRLTPPISSGRRHLGYAFLGGSGSSSTCSRAQRVSFGSFNRWRSCWLKVQSNNCPVVLEYAGQRIGEIFQEMPAIGNLHSIRRTIANRLRLRLGSVTCDNLNARMVAQPATHAFGGSVMQQVDDMSSFVVNQDDSIALSLPYGPVVDAENSWGRVCGKRGLACEGEEEIDIARKAEQCIDGSAGRATKKHTQLLLEPKEPSGSSCIWRHDGGQALGEDTA